MTIIKHDISPEHEIHDFPSHWQFESEAHLEADTEQHIYDPLQFSQPMAPFVTSTMFEDQGTSFASLSEAYGSFQFNHHAFHPPLDRTYQNSQPVIA